MNFIIGALFILSLPITLLVAAIIYLTGFICSTGEFVRYEFKKGMAQAKTRKETTNAKETSPRR